MFTYEIVSLDEDQKMKVEKFTSVEEIEKAWYTIIETIVWKNSSWLAWVEYPKLEGFLWGMKWNKEGTLIRYESQEVYNKMSY